MPIVTANIGSPSLIIVKKKLVMVCQVLGEKAGEGMLWR
jgi:hypothetical protein